ncbi:hypothetical protein R6Q57_017080 [Mikania cordata]
MGGGDQAMPVKMTECTMMMPLKLKISVQVDNGFHGDNGVQADDGGDVEDNTHKEKELNLGISSNLGNAVQRFVTSATLVELITPSVHINKTHLLINGKFVDLASGKIFPALDPHTGEVIANVTEGDTKDIDRAVFAACKAFDEDPWPKVTAYVKIKSAFRSDF